MHRANNAMIIQTEQLGRIETLEEELHSARGRVNKLEQKLVEQDCIITNLVGDNLDHLQDNMCLTTHINSLSTHLAQLEERMGQVGTLVYRMARGVLEGPSTEGSLSEAEMLGASGEDQGAQGGDEASEVVGASAEGSTRVGSPMPREVGLIKQMEREAMEAGLGGWFNGNPEDILESWSGSNSGALASQDRVGTTLLTTIGGRTLPNPVRVPDNVVQPAVLRLLMEGPIQPWQCLVWSETSPPSYSCDLPPLHTMGPSHVLLLLSRRWYILHYHRSTLLLPLGERLLLVVVEWKREVK